MKRVGLYFGSYNPVHVGHLIIAEYFATHTELDEVWMVVSPQNPFKTSANLASDHHRLEMVKVATADNPRIHACDQEFQMPKPSYTVDTLRVLQSGFPGYRFTIIMGSDNLAAFSKWKEYEYILQNFSIRVFPRPGSEPDLTPYPLAIDLQVEQAPMLELSSTYIRQSLSEGKSVRYLVHDHVLQYIHAHRLYL